MLSVQSTKKLAGFNMSYCQNQNHRLNVHQIQFSSGIICIILQRLMVNVENSLVREMLFPKHVTFTPRHGQFGTGKYLNRFI